MDGGVYIKPHGTDTLIYDFCWLVWGSRALMIKRVDAFFERSVVETHQTQIAQDGSQ